MSRYQVTDDETDRPKKIYTCETCHKDFVRLDLLQRHQRRHERGMSYRNSGGYVPDTPTSPSATHVSDAPTGEVDMSLPTEEVVPHQQHTDAMSSPLPVQSDTAPLTFETIDYPDFLQVPQMGTGHHVIFDASDGAQGLAEDLDWLFGNVALPEDFPMDPSLDITIPNDVSFASPNSTLSQQLSIDTPSLASGPWFTVRMRLLDALRTMPQDLSGDTFFDAGNLKSFFDIYFTNYNAHFPILHQASFNLDDAPPLLLAALLTLGATLSPDPAHYRTAERIHESLRWLIFSSGSFQPPAPLWCLQALLLVQAYEKMFSTRRHHEMAHIFHGAVITLMRRGGSYSSDSTDDATKASSAERAWHSWVEQESFKRVAYFAFVMDAQHSSIFGHTPALSVSDARDLMALDIETGRASDLGAESTPPSTVGDDNWKEILDRAIDTWSFSLMSQRPSLCLEAARPLHRMAHVTIYVNLIDFHTFAGAPSLTGGTTRHEYAKAKRRIQVWCERPSAKRTLSHCILLIQETMFTRRRYRASEDNIALRPWCLYHATLILWAFGILTEGKSAEMISAEDYLVHMLSGLMDHHSQLKGTNRTLGLLTVVKESLSDCRWELLQEACTTLGKLIELSVP
ncbi:hypothetical protein LTR47_007901 [Exophiala xenobiotica]|nr:hypothetical protein LTR47_007901 [Exophiala xenobiotica]KAK5248013.1 hypothetical protein LTS06_006881 [Exophiala xenobiotica]KAK5324910.1 hypothetical protein LTR93_004385 [Exophiala xenobiotica]KAK5352623.1 hypothetical protein LTR61_003749 [Exophiala xenobiotica]KAK5370245.1 hypothetical protein LTS13_006835 [Exophiala xenobiotica]